jgi:hypothetical protein
VETLRHRLLDLGARPLEIAQKGDDNQNSKEEQPGGKESKDGKIETLALQFFRMFALTSEGLLEMLPHLRRVGMRQSRILRRI